MFLDIAFSTKVIQNTSIRHTTVLELQQKKLQKFEPFDKFLR